MSRFNLLDEPWIAVIDHQGVTRELSLLDFFAQAHLYRDFAGDTKTQDFAVMRVLLAVLHTVFSRFDATGKPYPYLRLDERYKPSQPIKSDNQDDYEECLYYTWLDLYKSGKFPAIVSQYLEKWRERFYLFDEQYPFFQVREQEIKRYISNYDKKIKNSNGFLWGKQINRLISESSNSTAIFSPKNAENKEKLKESELVRWLLTYQGYSGASDKQKISKNASSIGWLYDLGGIYLHRNNLFFTLMLNLVLVGNGNDNLNRMQKPCWEYSDKEIIDFYRQADCFDNLAGLYTAWSRIVYINPNIDVQDSLQLRVVKLPEIEHVENFLEPMTVWFFGKKKNIKTKLFPKIMILTNLFGVLLVCWLV